MTERRDVLKLLLGIPAIGSAAIEPHQKLLSPGVSVREIDVCAVDPYDMFVYALRAVCAAPTEYNIHVVKWLIPSEELGVEQLRFDVDYSHKSTKIHCSYIRDGVPHVWRNLRYQMISR